VKITGERCGSPAVRDEDYCYYHRAVRKRVPRNNLHLILWNPQADKSERFEYEMPYPEDPESLQIAFSQFIHVVSQEEMKVERARLVLSALHGAAANMRAMEKSAMEREDIARAQEAGGQRRKRCGCAAGGTGRARMKMRTRPQPTLSPKSGDEDGAPGTEPQIPPLRFAPVGMTNIRRAFTTLQRLRSRMIL